MARKSAQLRKTRRDVLTISAIRPREHLAEELKERGMSAAELARQLDVPTNRVTEILNGRRAITGDTALRLAHFFRDHSRVSAQSPEPVRIAHCTEEAWKVDQPVADPQARRESACVVG